MTARERVSVAMRAMATPQPVEKSPTLRVAQFLFRNVWREVIWFADLDDDYGDPNLMKVMAVVFAVAAVQGVFVYHQPIAGLDIGMAFLACCAYAGYKGLKIFASWKGINIDDRRQTTRATIDQTLTVHEIQERRITAADGHDGQDFEPT